MMDRVIGFVQRDGKHQQASGPAPALRPRPPINRDNAFFWEGVQQRRLLIQICDHCGQLRHPPGPMCPACQATQWSAVESTGRGKVYSYVVMHWPTIAPFDYPIPVVLVEMEEGVRFVAGISGLSPDRLEIGQPVEVEYVQLDDEFLLPGFRPRDDRRELF